MKTPIVTPDDVYNRRLIENLHPASWVNPTPTEHYNLVVIGAGTGGLVSAAVGATIVGSHAGESIGEAVLAIKQKPKVGDLSGVIHPHPTQAEAIKPAADLQFRSRLKPWVRRLLGKCFRYRR